MKTCLFCGDFPLSKTKEHVFPRWLIALTGNPKRVAEFGKDSNSSTKIPWNSFTFPACNSCNNEFSFLEGRVKVVVLKLLQMEDLSETELNDLLDWLDKVRVGIWLGQIQLSKLESFEPNFYIKQRIGANDRMASIYYMENDSKGLGYAGCVFDTFKFSPSCFTLFINNIAIFNFSREFAFTRRLGFPYAAKLHFLPNDKRISFDSLCFGTERVMNPIVRKSIMPPSIRVYQGVLKLDLSGEFEKLKTSYFKRHFENGFFTLYVENDFTREQGFISNGLTLGTPTKFKKEFLLRKLLVQTLEFQNYSLMELCPSMHLLDKNERKSRLRSLKVYTDYNKNILEGLKRKLQATNSGVICNEIL
jgi:hypothetical protein